MRGVVTLALLCLVPFLGLRAPEAQAQPRLFGQEFGPRLALTCPDGMWMTGLKGRQSGMLNQLGIVCARIDLGSQRAVPPATIVGAHGGGGGQEKSVWCDNGSLPGGIEGVWNADSRAMRSVRLTCWRYTANVRRNQVFTENICAGFACPTSQPIGGPVRYGLDVDNAPGDRQGHSRCRNGQFMNGLEIWAFEFVTAVRPICYESRG